MNLFKTISTTILLVMSFTSLAEVSVIVNTANTDTFDEKTIKRIYLGKIKALANGEKVSVLTLADDAPETEQFRESALNKSNSQFKSYWSKIAFTGKGTPPTEVASNAEMINAIKSDPSSIGFINSNAVTGDVKVVATF
ncbi:MAG: phosphate ABC transporter substrate-binding protein [Colwellia sp. Phe_37]|jgi:ABC-type phosphate transport system substrate-binding protein|nr:MAG: phosphate ABC transporter substrate-binding protein [Colwellia sp. Phe_37]|tara:strand:+ start:18108 stop:18524 length:417 start_codon:yes stop_codon:yes gene_type:complete